MHQKTVEQIKKTAKEGNQESTFIIVLDAIFSHDVILGFDKYDIFFENKSKQPRVNSKQDNHLSQSKIFSNMLLSNNHSEIFSNMLFKTEKY